MLTWAVAEPVYHFQNNPDVIQGLVAGGAEETVRSAYKWAFLHWGLGAWACYAIAGLALGFFCYRRGLPLTMRSSLTPLFGKSLSGPLGHLIDIVAVVATILGVAQTLGFGVEQFVAGLTRIGIDGLTNDAGTANTNGVLVAIVAIMAFSTASALSGVGKGIKWLSNLNMGLSIFLLAFFLLFGATWFGLQALFVGIWDYVIALPEMMFTVWRSDGVDGSVATQLEGWQGAWSVFYWAWWIAFAPFVGLFLARISKGRTIREFVLGAIIVPSLMCFVWFTWAGGTAIELTLNGDAGEAIFGAPDGDKIFAHGDPHAGRNPGLGDVDRDRGAADDLPGHHGGLCGADRQHHQRRGRRRPQGQAAYLLLGHCPGGGGGRTARSRGPLNPIPRAGSRRSRRRW